MGKIGVEKTKELSISTFDLILAEKSAYFTQDFTVIYFIALNIYCISLDKILFILQKIKVHIIEVYK